MDKLWKEKNHELFLQALRYEEEGVAARDAATSTLLFSAFIATLRCHAQAELSRLVEKERWLRRQGNREND